MKFGTLVGNATMKAFAFTGESAIGLIEEIKPIAGSGELVVEVAFLGICGTDVHLLHGTSSYVRSGLTTYPIRFGHEWSGIVHEVGPDVHGFSNGDRVIGEPFVACGHCLICRAGHYNLCPERSELGVRGQMAGAAAQFFKVPAANVHRIPDGVALDEAVLAEPSVTILNSFEMGNIQPGERVAVIGTGTMGLIAIQIASHMGCLVDSIGVVDSELTVARDLGANNTFKPQTAPDGAYSAVIEASGSSSVGPELARIAAIGGRIMQVGIPGSPVDGFDLAAFVSKGLSLIGVLGGVHLMPKALELIRKGAIRPDGLIDEVIDSSRIEEAFERAATGGRGKPKILVDLRSLGQQEAATMKEANG